MGRQLFGYDVAAAWDHENGFHLTSHVTRIGKILAHYELFKLVRDVPGAIVECGVFKAVSLVQFATFRELLDNEHARRIVAFDAFGRFPGPFDAADEAFVRQFEQRAGTGIPLEELRAVLEHKRWGNIELIAGDLCETVPRYVADHPELKIALLHIDVDVYRPTKAALDHLYDRVPSGGVIVLDDYGTVGGATRAVDEFLRGRDVAITRLPIAHVPAYIRK